MAQGRLPDLQETTLLSLLYHLHILPESHTAKSRFFFSNTEAQSFKIQMICFTSKQHLKS